jgi:hypothetical protein
VPSGITEFPGTHDLGADTRIVQPQEGVVDSAATAGLAGHLVPPPGDEHPFVQPFAGMAERRVAALRFAGAETVERDREELDAGERHDSCSFPDPEVSSRRWWEAAFVAALELSPEPGSAAAH